MKTYLTMLIVLILSTSFSSAKVRFSESQKENMRFACNYGKKVIVNKDDTCFLFAAIAWQESSAGKILTNKNKNHKSHGLFQNYVVTVKNRLKQQGVHKSDKQIIQMLKTRWNSAKFAEIELKYWLKQHKGNLSKALASYNAGWKWQRGANYSKEVIRKRNYLIANNRSLKIRN